MDLRNVSMNDGKACAYLLNLLKSGRWDFSGAEAAIHVDVVKWVFLLANKMAEQLKESEKPKSEAPADFSIKSMGQLPVTPPPKRRGKKK